VCWKLYRSGVDIDLLYIADCPNRRLARRHLEVALARTELAVAIRECEVTSAEEATRLGMRGSPTILIDGRDPFTGRGPTAVSCRLYRTEAGLSGAPTVNEIVAVLRHGRLAPDPAADGNGGWTR
jgi:hypothetical protein